MQASVIWYRTRPTEGQNIKLSEFFDKLHCVRLEDSATIKSDAIPGLMAAALGKSNIIAVVGGMSLMREEENIVFVLSKHMDLKLETGAKSRSKHIYDTLRGTPLPSFESAVLFPAPGTDPEGVVLTAGSQAIILLPESERAFGAVLDSMSEYLPKMMGIKNPEEKKKSEFPEYIEKARARHAPKEPKKDRVIDADELRRMFSQKIRREEAVETNRAGSSETPQKARPAAFHSNSDRRAEEERRIAEQRRMAVFTKTPVSKRLIPLYRAVSVLIVVMIIITTCVIASKYYTSGLIEAPEAYQSELSQMYGEAAENGQDSGLPTGALAEFAKLYSENDEVSGYLSIPGTSISQPVLRSSAEDPDFYKKNNFYGVSDEHGALRFDHNVNISLTAENINTVIYGNSPSDGSMFAQLSNYTDIDFYSRHAVINMDTLYEKSQWIVFSACVVSSDTISEFNYANTTFIGAYSREVYLYNIFIRSLFYTPVEVFPTEQLLTLVTDSDEFQGAKMVVCARKVRDGEDLSGISEGIVANDIVLMPDIWYELNNANKPQVPRLEVPTEFSIETEDAYFFSTSSTTTTTTTTVATTTTTATAGTTVPTTTGGGGQTQAPQTQPPTTLAPSATAQNMRITSGGRIIEDTTPNVLAMIIEAEMGSGYSYEALKAQAVAAYTFYLYSGGSAKAPSFPTKTPSSVCRQAAAEVAGQYMSVSGKVPYTPYYAISAGATANNRDINGSDLGYLVSVDCSVDKAVSGYSTVKTVPASTVANKVMASKGIDLYMIADKNQWFKVLERDANGLYVTSVQVGPKSYRGNTLHLSILGYSCLRSPCFWISYDAASDSFIFTSYGYGTGVGMSQKGANEYAKQGHNYVWILQHFYTGITIKN